MKQETKSFLRKKLAVYAELKLFPSGVVILFTYDYDNEDEDAGFTQQLANQCWAYPQDLWNEVLELREELWDEREQFRGLTQAFWKLRAVRETKLLNYYRDLMPKGWTVDRGLIPGDDYQRHGFYITVS
jgi:hypothetical protein